MDKASGRPGGLSSQATEPVPVSAVPASIPDATVIQLHVRASHATPRALADAWEGIVQMMEANGRAKVEIGLADARWVAAMARRACP